jgi:hypothetical protein
VVIHPRHQNLIKLKNINSPKTILNVINGAMEKGLLNASRRLLNNLPITHPVF